MLSKNFLSVKKTKEISWDALKPMVISHINDYFEKNEGPILTAEISKVEDKNETIKLIKEAYKGDKVIGVIAQRDVSVEDPEFDDLHSIGTWSD